MAEFRFTELAKADLDDIAAFSLERWGLEQALSYLDGLEQVCAMLADNPNLGPSAAEIEPNLRRRAYQSHVIFYEADANGVLIIRVLHHSRDVTRAFP